MVVSLFQTGIRAEPNMGAQGFANGINSAILRYVGAPATEPHTMQTQPVASLREARLHPLLSSITPGQYFSGGADLALNLALGFDDNDGKFYINGISYVSPDVPILLQILSGAKSAQDLMPTGSVYTLPRNKVVEISIPALDDGGPHPFHLHGVSARF